MAFPLHKAEQEVTIMLKRTLSLLLAGTLLLSGCAANCDTPAPGVGPDRSNPGNRAARRHAPGGNDNYGYHRTCDLSGGRLLLGH